MRLTYLELRDAGDERGNSYGVPGSWFAEAFAVRDTHISTVLPGHTRGDHFHELRHEVLIVTYAGNWSLHWDEGAGGVVHHRDFTGKGAVLVRIPPPISHAVRNDGTVILHLVGISDGPFDPAAPDIFPRKVSSR